MAKVNYITEAGLRKLRSELDALKAERPVISAQIAEARDKGDLSENAEYDAAKEAQGMLEMRIAKLEATIAGARIIDESKLGTDSIQMLNRVTIKNMNLSKTVEYTIVSENEANLKEGKLLHRDSDRPGADRQKTRRRRRSAGAFGYPQIRSVGYFYLTIIYPDIPTSGRCFSAFAPVSAGSRPTPDRWDKWFSDTFGISGIASDSEEERPK